MRKLKKIFFTITSLAAFYILALIFPNPLFSNSYEYVNFTIYSDQVIDENINSIIDQANELLEKSELYFPDVHFKVFICNDQRRFRFFTRSKNAGGVVQGILSRNIFIRESDIKNNQIIPPGSWLMDRTNRPLSYFFAHEATHSLQSYFDRFMILKAKAYIMEGYADYIAKSNSFVYEEYVLDLINDHPKMDPSNGLYNRYHLYIAYLIEKKGLSFEEILELEPELVEVIAEIKSNP